MRSKTTRRFLSRLTAEMWQQDVTIEDLSRAAGITRHTLSRLINGRQHTLKINTADALAGYFGKDLVSFLE